MAEDVQLWSPTAASNGAIDPAVNWAEGQARASVNNSARSMMAAHAKDRNLKNGSIVTGGTANAQTILSGLSYTTIPTGLEVLVKIGPSLTSVKNTPVTINMDGIGAVGLLDQEGVAIEKGLVAGAYAHMLYNGTNWIFLDASVVNVSNVTLITQITVIDSSGGGTPVAFVDFTDLDTTEFQKYQLVCTNMLPEITEQVMVFNLSRDNGVTFPQELGEYNSAEMYTSQGMIEAAGTSPTFGFAQSFMNFLQFTWNIDTVNPETVTANSILELYGFEPNTRPTVTWRSSHYHPGSAFATIIDGSGYAINQSGFNAIRIWASEGNIIRGTFSLYGIPL